MEGTVLGAGRARTGAVGKESAGGVISSDPCSCPCPTWICFQKHHLLSLPRGVFSSVGRLSYRIAWECHLQLPHFARQTPSARLLRNGIKGLSYKAFLPPLRGLYFCASQSSTGPGSFRTDIRHSPLSLYPLKSLGGSEY